MRPTPEPPDQGGGYARLSRFSHELSIAPIPIGPTKDLFPVEREYIAVRLRGCELTCRWDPRYGQPERLGVIRIGRAAARALLAAGEALTVQVTDGCRAQLRFPPTGGRRVPRR